MKFYNEIISTLQSPFPRFIGLIILVIYLLNWKKLKQLNSLTKHFNGRLAWYSFLIPSFRGEASGLKFRILVTNKSHYSAGFLNIFLYKDSFYKLKICKKNFIGQTTFK